MTSIWTALDRLVDRAPTIADLRSHRLETFAARRWRALGRPVPAELEEAERLAALAVVSTEPLLARIRAAYDGPLLLLKGPELGARYPDPTLRPFRDLDLLVPDPAAAQQALVEAGFEVVEGETDQPRLHHRPPLLSPGLPLIVELHDRPKWPNAARPPEAAELLELAVPAHSVAVVSTLPPAPHAVLVAAHSWAHLPLRRILDLVDLAVLARESERAELAEFARLYGVERVWSTMSAAADHLLDGGPKPFPLRTWARNLPAARERTVLESHLERWLSPFDETGRRRALRESGRRIGTNIRPAPGQTWRAKLARTRVTLRNSFERKSVHDESAHGQSDSKATPPSNPDSSSRSRPSSRR